MGTGFWCFNMRTRAWVLLAALAAALAALVAAGGADAGLAAAQRLGDSAFAPNGLARNGSSSSWVPLWRKTASQKRQKDKMQTLAELHAENVWKNDLVLWVLPAETRAKMPMIVQVRAAGARWWLQEPGKRYGPGDSHDALVAAATRLPPLAACRPACRPCGRFYTGHPARVNPDPCKHLRVLPRAA